MPKPPKTLSQQERSFALALAAGLSPAAARRAAGWKLQQTADAKAQQPEIKRAVRDVRAELLKGRDNFLAEAAPEAQAVVLKNLRNDAAPLLQERAANKVLDLTTARLHEPLAAESIDLASLTAEELARRIAELEAMAADRAIDVTPSDPFA
jgi:hypothetical protein